MKFELNEAQVAALEAWKEEIYAKGVEIQKAKHGEADWLYQTCWESGYPYTGAIGGSLAFTIVPTSIGDLVTVRDSVTGMVLDLSELGGFG